MANIDTIYDKGYIYKKSDLNKFGSISHIKDEYEVYVKVVVTAKLFGIQVDKRSKTYKLPIKLRSFMVHSYKNVSVTVNKNVYSGSVNNSFYDETLDEKLGGQKELLGA